MPSRSWEQTLVPRGCNATTHRFTNVLRNPGCARTLSSIYERSIFVVPDPFVRVHDSKARWVSGNVCPDKHVLTPYHVGNRQSACRSKGEIPILTVELTSVSTAEALHRHINNYIHTFSTAKRLSHLNWKASNSFSFYEHFYVITEY